MADFQVVAAFDRRTRGLGAAGRIPWSVPEDWAHFRRLTTETRDPQRQNAVVMGRVTYESIGQLNRPLPGRINVVLSSTGAFRSLEAALVGAVAQNAETVFVAGGEAVYREALALPRCTAVHVTEIDLPASEAEGEAPAFDRFFPDIDPEVYALWSADATPLRSRKGPSYRRLTYVRRGTAMDVPRPLPAAAVPHPEQAYSDLVRRAIREGVPRADRTGTGTRSLFGAQIRFSLRDGLFPLLTTKRVFFRGVLEELLWFVRGSTDARELAAKGVHIWDANAEAHAKAARLPEPGPLGPVYGAQWRRFGSTFPEWRGGFDQLAEVLRLVCEEPESRRNILTAWNPVDLSSMALPPCHLLSQFWVHDGQLSCLVTMRSCDLGLGLPFNIASYALLTHMVAASAGLAVGDLVFSLGDTHVYENHIEALEVQLKREPRPRPRLRPLPARERLEDYVASDFVVVGYDPWPSVPMKMSV